MSEDVGVVGGEIGAGVFGFAEGAAAGFAVGRGG